ncbi:MAG: TRAP transporter substrate-binding protein [Rhizobiaceae bacterium]
MLSRRSFITLAASALPMPALVGRARAARRVIAASLLGEQKPETLVWTHIRDRVEAEMPGAFTFDIVPNAALGGEKEVAEGLRVGSVQASLSTLSNLSTWVPESQLYDLPFLFRDAAHQRAALAGSCGGDLRRRLEAQGLVAPAFIYYGARHLLAREPLTTPAAMKGKRIRVIQSPLHAQLWEEFGALPVALPITETYNALATGHVDAMDLTKSAHAGFKLYEVVPQVTETGHIHAAGTVLFSGLFWSGLSPDEKAVLERAASEGGRHFDALMAKDEAVSVEAARKGGAVFHAVADRAAWEAPARKVWESFAGRVGGMARIEAVAAMREAAAPACG